MSGARTFGLALAVLALGCGGEDGDGGPDASTGLDDVCDVEPGEDVSFDPGARLCDKLSSYRFFVGDLAAQEPNDRVVPYDVNTPLFSDYAVKSRFLWVPEGTQIVYSPDQSFEFPDGAVLIKSFGYPDDLREPDGPGRVIETRLLFLSDGEWEGIAYVWNEDQSEAERQVAGAIVPVSWTHTDGAVRELDYSVPNKNKCKNCHEELDDIVGPIGPKARHLNREFDYPDGVDNQLVRLSDLGMLTGLPDLADVPTGPVWDDPATGTLDERARMWLDINCAHCHNPRGAARTSGLDLSFSQTNPIEFGVCKSPVAAGSGSGGLQYNIVPGAPDDSIFMFRLLSTVPDVLMPEVGRRLVDDEGVELIRAWIEAMPGDCGT